MRDGLSKSKKHYWLYVLLLEENKYYIGITSRYEPEDRIQEHFNGFYSAQWVKKYKPKKLVEVLDAGYMTDAETDDKELKLTLEYMKKFGHQNVRGGILNYSGKYYKFGRRYVRDEEFYTMSTVLLLMAAVAALLIDKYNK